MLSVIIPANNEEAYLGRCLEALLVQEPGADGTVGTGGVEVIVAANGCTDATVAIARDHLARFEARGWRLVVLDIAAGGKINALNHADSAATGGNRLYLDADVAMGPDMLRQLGAALDRPDPVYASGRLTVAPARTLVTRCYAALWQRLPFMRSGVPGAGLFAVNAAGRARWGAFPDIISDDTYVRLLFAPDERVAVDECYEWPMIEGFWPLVRVRRRQDRGVHQIAERYPQLMRNEGKDGVGPLDHLRLLAGLPIPYAVYVSVALAVRLGLGQRDGGWSRGR